MSFKSREHKELPTSERILDYLNPEDIYIKYLGGIPKKPIKSPLRDEEHPSFSLFYSKKYDTMLWKDFATGDTGNCFKFVKLFLNLDSYIDVYNRIADDFNLHAHFYIRNGVQTGPSLIKKRVLKREVEMDQENRTIQIKRKPWAIQDKKFWHGKYGLTRKQLEYCGVFPISHYWVGKVCFKGDKLAYAYIEKKDGNITYKIYQPRSKFNKWKNGNNASTWELWRQLPARGRNLIICSSRKDAMVVKSLFPSTVVTACSLQAEGVYPKVQVVDELKKRFKNVYVLYDNDNAGVKFGTKLAKNFGLKYIEIPKTYKVKDIADVISWHRAGVATALLKRLIKEYNDKT